MTRFLFACVLVLSGIVLVSVWCTRPDAVPFERRAASLDGRGQSAAGAAQGVQNTVADGHGPAVRHAGLEGGIGLNPQLINLGVYATFGPAFSEAVSIRPAMYLSFGEVTTEFGFDIDGLFTLPWSASDNWRTYAGVGANFALNHESFEVPATAPTIRRTTTEDRFDFSDTDFKVRPERLWAKNPNGAFVEVKGTAFGVGNVKLLAGFRF